VSAVPAEASAVRVTFEPEDPRTGAPLRVRIHGDGPFAWRIGRSVHGAPSESGVTHVVADGTVVATPEGTAVDVTLPDGTPPSFEGALLTVLWWVWVKPDDAADSDVHRIPVRPGVTTFGRKELEARGHAWLAAQTREAIGLAAWQFVVAPILAAVLVCAIGGGALTLGGVRGALLALIGLGVIVGSALRAAEVMRPAWRALEGRRAMDVSGVPLAGPGASFELPVRMDPARFRRGGSLAWTLRRTEGRARRVEVINNNGRSSTETRWTSRATEVASGRVSGPPWTDRVLEIPVPADAPPTLDLELTYVRYDVVLRCGAGERAVPVWVAPYALR
jgi:hypothetical protein